MASTTHLNPFTLSGFATPDEVYRRIMGQNMASSAPLIRQIIGNQTPRSGGAANIGEAFGAGFGQAWGSAIAAKNSPEIQQAKDRQAILSDVKGDTEEEWTKALGKVKNDPQMKLFIMNRLYEINDQAAKQEATATRLDLAATRNKISQDRLDNLTTHQRVMEEQGNRRLGMQEKFGQALVDYRQTMGGIAQQKADTSKDKFKLQEKEWDTRKNLIEKQMENYDSLIALRESQKAYTEARTGVVGTTGRKITKATEGQIKATELEFKNGKYATDGGWRNLGMSKENIRYVSRLVADRAAKLSGAANIPFSDARDQIVQSLQDAGAFTPKENFLGLTAVEPNIPPNPNLSPEDPAAYGYTEEDVTHNMQKYGKTREEVIQKMKEMGNQ